MGQHDERLASYTQQGLIPQGIASILHHFFISYAAAIAKNGYRVEQLELLLKQFVDLVADQLANPYQFELFHQKNREPFDFYRFGLDLLRPLVIFEKSTVHGLEHVDAMETAIQKGENIILFGNHQTEPDPQAINLLLEKTHSNFASEIIFVAGHRVISDPLAVPFSRGCNLLCIFSKRYIETETELKQEKLAHNQRTMKKMAQLLAEGGKCIYVAPSGGRDRRGHNGVVQVAPFDSRSIEMFWLMAQQSERPTHFHPLALSTYDLLPPPSTVEAELGESRHTLCTPIHLAFGPAIDMKNCVNHTKVSDKRQLRKLRADYIWKIVCEKYKIITAESQSPEKKQDNRIDRI